MKKYRKELVLNYINGLDVENIDELENDKNFMLEVLKVSKDKNTYDVLPEKIRNDYEFNKNVLMIFKNDINFVCDLSSKMFSLTDNLEEKFELSIIMKELTKKEDLSINGKYIGVANAFFQEIYVYCNKIINSLNPELKRFIGIGFLVFQEEFSNNKIILDYVSKKLIEEIFYEQVNLEEDLHNLYNNYKKFVDSGKTNIIMQYLMYYDYYLSNYVALNVDLLSIIDVELKRIKNNWDNYNSKMIDDKYFVCEDIIDEVYEFCFDNASNFDVQSIILKVAKEFGVYEQMLCIFEIEHEQEIAVYENYLMGLDEYTPEYHDPNVYKKHKYKNYNEIDNIKDYKDYKCIKKIFANKLGK